MVDKRNRKMITPQGEKRRQQCQLLLKTDSKTQLNM